MLRSLEFFRSICCINRITNRPSNLASRAQAGMPIQRAQYSHDGSACDRRKGWLEIGLDIRYVENTAGRNRPSLQ